MKQSLYYFIVIMLIAYSFFSCDNSSEKKRINEYSDLTSPTNQDTNPAMSHPDKFAWDLFLELNQASSKNPKLTIWETWALASDVYSDPNSAPKWQDQVEKDIENFETMPLQQLAHLNIDPKDQFDPNSPTRNETRMNRPAFDFIVENDLYYAEGLEKIYSEYPNKKIDLPIEAKEIKAIWAEISVNDTINHHFALGKNGEKYYGLKGIHIITKDIPNWFWSTFEHVDNLENSEEFKNNKELLTSKDNYGYDSNGVITKRLQEDFLKNNLPDKWKYYRLRGTQTDFTNPKGKPIVLANSLIEDGFMLTSSCITCHARATIGALPQNFEPTPFRTYNRLDIFKNDDGGPNSPGVIGKVDPSLFYKEYSNIPADSLVETGKPQYIQTDFMWSFFRAKRKNN